MPSAQHTSTKRPCFAHHDALSGMGVEFHGKGSNVQLGPGLCVARVPRNGRNFEYLSGEDPYLGYRMVQPAIQVRFVASFDGCS